MTSTSTMASGRVVRASAAAIHQPAHVLILTSETKSRNLCEKMTFLVALASTMIGCCRPLKMFSEDSSEDSSEVYSTQSYGWMVIANQCTSPHESPACTRHPRRSWLCLWMMRPNCCRSYLELNVSPLRSAGRSGWFARSWTLSVTYRNVAGLRGGNSGRVPR